jgi:hypothetical protein
MLTQHDVQSLTIIPMKLDYIAQVVQLQLGLFVDARTKDQDTSEESHF